MGKKPKLSTGCIVVTGTPGCGKTRFAKKLASLLGWKYIDGKKIIADMSSFYDRKGKCYVVEEKAFAKEAIKRIDAFGGKAVLDSHLGQYVSPGHCRACIVIICPLKTLYSRLTKRGYSKMKVEENMMCETMEICKQEGFELGHYIIEVIGVGFPDMDLILRKLRLKQREMKNQKRIKK